ncbi:Lipase 1 [Fusarium agapanthi]|uniref:Lipase 1 n=1 Tax=Fusarium agapanthi TaxID=1803897 RepID=A0A9P5BIB0_9HYPO|nr:Lipase 1 [Fusarium agapanthi]
MSTFTNQEETFFNRCGLTDAVGDDAGWAPGQDPGFGPLQSPPDETESGGKVPALEDRILAPTSAGMYDKKSDDQLNIKKLATIGDSYSAGIGAGKRLGSIYDVLKEGNADVLEKQIPRLDNNQEAITLSIGGNDVGLVDLLNSCIFQMGALTPVQAAKAKLITLTDEQYAWAKDWDWDRLSQGCGGQTQYTRALIQGNVSSKRLDQVLIAAKKFAKEGKIYVTGYAKFFAKDLSADCDKQAAVDRAGDSVKFINYDQFVGNYGGRYCEAGVDESTTESNTRKGLMFYELNTWDPAGTSPWKRGAEGGELNGTFYGDMLVLSQITRFLDPNAELHHYGDDAKKALAARVAILDYLIPDGYGRVFDPQIPLHEMIASLVVYEIMKDYQVRIGYAVWTPPPDNTSCRLKPSPAPSAPPKPPPPPTRPTLIPLPPFEPKYDSKGCKLCSGPLLRLKDCDHAVNYLRRGTDPPFEKGHLNGNCWGKSDGIGCGVFPEGEGCKMKGYDMWDWYQKIRKDGERCTKCGKVEYKEGCTLKIDYVTGCNNHG